MWRANWKYLVLISLFAIAIGIVCTSAMTTELDEKGVPIIDYGFVSPKGDSSDTKKDGWQYVGRQRNPLTISAHSLTYYKQYLQGNESSKKLFLNCSDWLIDNAVSKGDILVWEYKYPWPTYGNTPPFLSGMSQASAIRSLATAYNLTGEDKYRNAAEKGLGAFYVEVDKGGITYKDPMGWWYEEYAQKGMDAEPRVLNGHISALLDLHEYHNLTQDKMAKELFDLGVSDLKANLKYYDARNESRYDRVGNKAVFKYHDLHVAQLDSIYKITGDRYFKLYRDRWAQYELDVLQKSSDKTNKSIEKLQLYQSELSKKKSGIKAMISEEENQDSNQTPPPQQNTIHGIISKLLNPF